VRECERVGRLGMWVGREEDDRIRMGGGIEKAELTVTVV